MVMSGLPMAAGAILVAACARSPSSPSPQRSAIASSRATLAPPAPSVIHSDASLVDASVPMVPAPVPGASYIPLRSKPGKIHCGTTECDASSEVCCLGLSTGRCQDKAQSCDHDKENQRACDEAADCPVGQLCCETGAGQFSRPLFRCEDRRKGWRGLCGGGPESLVLGGEVCMPGSSCRGARTCSFKKSRPGYPGFCSAPTSVRCVNEVCSGETPICTFGLDQAGTLQGDCEKQSPHGMACASPDDCAGYPCLAYGASDDETFRCGDLFDVWGNARGALCRQVGDCPSMYYGRTDIELKPIACRRDPHLPGGAKRCSYPPEPN